MGYLDGRARTKILSFLGEIAASVPPLLMALVLGMDDGQDACGVPVCLLVVSLWAIREGSWTRGHGTLGTLTCNITLERVSSVA